MFLDFVSISYIGVPLDTGSYCTSVRINRNVSYFLFWCVWKLCLPLHDAGGSGRDLGPQIGTLLGDWTGDSRSLHLTLGVDDNTSVILEVDESALSSSPRLSLSDDNGLKNLLSQLRLTLLDGNHHHISNSGAGQTVESSTNTLDGDDIKVLTTTVIGTVDQRCNSQTEGDSQLRATRSSTYIRICVIE